MKQDNITLNIKDLVLLKQYPDKYLEKELSELTVKSRGGTELAKPVLTSIRRHGESYGALGNGAMKYYSATLYDQKGNIISHSAPYFWSDYWHTGAMGGGRFMPDEAKNLHLMYTGTGKFGKHGIEREFIYKNDDGSYKVRSVTLATSEPKTGNPMDITISKHNDFSPENEEAFKMISTAIGDAQSSYDLQWNSARDEIMKPYNEKIREWRYENSWYEPDPDGITMHYREVPIEECPFYNPNIGAEAEAYADKKMGSFKNYLRNGKNYEQTTAMAFSWNKKDTKDFFSEKKDLYTMAEENNMKLTIRNRDKPEPVDREVYTDGINWDKYDFKNNKEFMIREDSYAITDGVNIYGLCPKGKNPYGTDYDKPPAGRTVGTIETSEIYTDSATGYVVDNKGNRYGKLNEKTGEYEYPKSYRVGYLD